MRAGAYEVSAVVPERFRLDGGAMFGVVPKPLWEKTNPPDERNRITLAGRVLVLRGEGRVALVDAGVGDKEGEKFREIYGVESLGGLEGTLAGIGVRPAEVTDVILTHLHFDHAGGGTRREGGSGPEGRCVPAFPRATYHVQSANLEQARHPNERDRASYFRENFEPLVDGGILREHAPDGEILPGVFARVVNGHTPGQQMIEVGEGPGRVVFPGDLVPTAGHLPTPYVMGYDLLPLVAMEEKKRWFAAWAEAGAVLVFDHDPATEAVRIRPGPRGYFEIAERVRL